ncbi:MAG: glutamine synthetase family protein [Actinomycetota bacterium]
MAKSLEALQAELKAANIDVLRVIYLDILGVIRAKDMLVSQLGRIAHGGPTFCQGVWVTTTGGDVLDGNSLVSDGLEDFVSQVVPESWRPLPWEPGVAYAVAGANNPDGTQNLLSPRTVLETVVKKYEALGLAPVVGPELEFYIAEQDENGKYRRAIEHKGQVYTAGSVVDPKGTFLNLLRMVDQMNIGVFAGNHEFSPSQYEINFWHGPALDAADRTLLLKTAVKEVVARAGQHATFCGKPWSDEGGSGFHLHFSVEDLNGKNAMHDGGDGFSDNAKHMIAGIIKHAAALTAFCNPTINAFKRLGPDTLAPYRANWGLDNRSAMIRIPPERGEGTRLEVRVADGAANPYLMIAAILAAGLDGIVNKLAVPEPVVGLSYDNESAPILPMSLEAALDALKADSSLRELLAGPIVDVFDILKRDEVRRYRESVADPETREVTDWEVTEYMSDY